jgi:hypothetical protein
MGFGEVFGGVKDKVENKIVQVKNKFEQDRFVARQDKEIRKQEERERNLARTKKLATYEEGQKLKFYKEKIKQKYATQKKRPMTPGQGVFGTGIMSNFGGFIGSSSSKKKKKEESPYSSSSVGKMFDFKF